jgi:PTS system nitrogen regulatory IIA component
MFLPKKGSARGRRLYDPLSRARSFLRFFFTAAGDLSKRLTPIFLVSVSTVPQHCKESAVKRIAELLLSEDILLDVEASSKSELMDEIGEHMQRLHAIARESVALSLSHREQIGSTGLGEGVAIPHARVKHLDHVQVAYLRLKSPIPFDSPDGKPVTDVLVLLVPKQATEEHLTILAEAAQMLSDRRFRERLHLCGHPLEAKRLFEGWPEGRPGY